MADLRNQRVVVMGLGHFGGGISVARWLAEQGARVLVTDKESAENLEHSVAQLEGLPIEYRLGEHCEADFTGADLVVASPAVPLNNPFLQAARNAGVPITTEMRLFVERCPAKRILGVTGTKGKSTTTAMLHAILASRYKAWLGGNIGRSLLAHLSEIQREDLVVLELSSFMLEHLRPLQWSPHIAVITMVARDHIEWHGSVDAYIDAKKVLVQFQRPGDFAILNETCPRCMDFARASAGQARLYGLENRRRFEIGLVGEHNQLNAQAAFAAASCLDVSWDQAQTVLAGFKALRHRLELVHEEHGVRFFNDSIATIPEAAVAALEAFEPKKVIQIVGGRLMDHSLTALCSALVHRAKAVLCIGEKGREIAELVGQSAMNAAPPAYICADLPTAMHVGKIIAHPGDVVLLSTGCKSYDQFDNFEQRGDVFTALARNEPPPPDWRPR